MDVEAKVKEIIMDKLGVEESQITPEASFTNDLGADSLDIVELLWVLKAHFKSRFLMKMQKKLLQWAMQQNI
jgi:acyl carrier protein